MNILNANTNVILAGDSYKYSHAPQIPKGTKYINSYIESRGSDNPVYTATLFAGIQILIKQYLTRPVTQADVDEAATYVEPHGLPFNRVGWEYIVNECNGKLPIVIEAVPEGTIVPMSNVLVQIRNTDPNVPWLTSFIETLLLRGIWYMTTVATKSWTIKKMFLDYAKKSGSDEFVDFKLHDFGARGVSSGESAMLGGIGHLMVFQGTDTMEAIVGARKAYNIEMAGFSIPATEHSTTTIWGRENEFLAYQNMVDTFAKPDVLFAMVIDSYNREKAVEMISQRLQSQIRESGATAILRPDSGDPTVEPIETIKQLMGLWGKTYNKAGFKTLPDCIRVIQGDGININSIPKILNNLYTNNLSLDNLAFGMGGGLLQQNDRDVFKFAQKASYAIVDGEGRNVSKDPIGDKSKRSKDGVLNLVTVNGDITTVSSEDFNRELGSQDLLRKVYENGELLIDDNLVDIRARVDYTV
jgi:nicotinamide phosphoribosyltransferase